MSLSASALANNLISMMDSKASAASSTDYMKEISTVVENYLKSNWSGSVSWIAATTTTPPTPDPVVTTTAKCTSVTIGWRKSQISGMTSPATIKTTLNTIFSTNIVSATFGPAASGFVFTCTASAFTFGTIDFCCPNGSDTDTDGTKYYWYKDENNTKHGGIDNVHGTKTSEYADYKANMKYLATSIVKAVTGACTLVIPSGTHGSYVSTGSSIVELS